MIDFHGILLSDAEADGAADVGQDAARLRGDVLVANVETHGHVSAGDIEADAADRDVLFISHDAANGMSIAEVPVCAENALGGAACLHAAIQLLYCLFIMLAEDPGIHRASWLLWRHNPARPN